jgi:hypothetical protein
LTTYVFFKGYGFWKYTEDSESFNFMDCAATYRYEVSGIFQLEKKDELEYKYTGNIKLIKRLLPCNHPDDEFKRAIINKAIHKENISFEELTYEPEYYSFHVCLSNSIGINYSFKVIDLEYGENQGDQENNTEQNVISDLKGYYVCDAQDSYMSENLLILNEASKKFWGNADPKEKDTHPKKNVIENYLINKKFSNIAAQQGASIIRPSWAVSGRRGTD